MNSTNLTGRITAEPRRSDNGTTRCWFTLAVDRPGSDQADFIPITCFDKLAAAVAEHTGKGHLVAVEGRLRTSSYDQDGTTVYRTDVIARRIEFLKAPKDNGQTTPTSVEDADAEPF